MLSKLCGRMGKKGQGMTEYIIILAVVAVVSIAIVTQFGAKIKNIFTKSDAEIGKVEALVP